MAWLLTGWFGDRRHDDIVFVVAFIVAGFVTDVVAGFVAFSVAVGVAVGMAGAVAEDVVALGVAVGMALVVAFIVAFVVTGGVAAFLEEREHSLRWAWTLSLPLHAFLIWGSFFGGAEVINGWLK